jgi:hypothetical protein
VGKEAGLAHLGGLREPRDREPGQPFLGRERRRAYFGVPPAPSSLWLVESAFFGTLEIAVTAPSVDAVDAFYFAAVSASARIVGEPGIVADRSGDYYAARVLDPDGNRLEVVHRVAAAVAA